MEHDRDLVFAWRARGLDWAPDDAVTEPLDRAIEGTCYAVSRVRDVKVQRLTCATAAYHQPTRSSTYTTSAVSRMSSPSCCVLVGMNLCEVWDLRPEAWGLRPEPFMIQIGGCSL